MRPWSVNEASLILSRLGKEGFSESQTKLYEHIVSELGASSRWQSEDFSFSARMELSAEYYRHTNDQDFVLPEDWVRGFYQRKPLAKLKLDMGISPLFYTYADLQYGYGRYSTLDNYTDLSGAYIASYKMQSGFLATWTQNFAQQNANNFIKASKDFLFEWPQRCLVSVGGQKWNLSINRDWLNIGNSEIGNLLINNHNSNNYAKLSFFSNLFKYNFVTVFLDTRTHAHENVRDSEARVYLIHSLEFRPTKWLNLTISENATYRYDIAEFQFFNPGDIFHNLNYRSMFNAFAYAELNITPFKGFNLYGQFALDQAQAPNEGDEQAGSWGILGGINYSGLWDLFKTSSTSSTSSSSSLSCPLSCPLSYKVYAEYAFTTPLLYRKDQVDFIKITRFFTMAGGRAFLFEYLGFPYGGDAKVLKLGAKINLAHYASFELYAQAMEHGVMNIFMSHNKDNDNDGFANYPGRTPSGEVIDRSLIISSKLKLDASAFFSWPGLCLEAQFDFINRAKYTKATATYSNKQTDAQLSLSATLSL